MQTIQLNKSKTCHLPDSLLVLSVQINHLLLRAAFQRRQRRLRVDLLVPRLLVHSNG